MDRLHWSGAENKALRNEAKHAALHSHEYPTHPDRPDQQAASSRFNKII